MWAARRATWALINAEVAYESEASRRISDEETRLKYAAMWDARRAADAAWAELIEAADVVDGVVFVSEAPIDWRGV